jgi:hypothetical protein
MRTPYLPLFGLLAALAGCDTPPEPEPAATPFGEAVRKNILVQAVNPEGAPPPAVEPGLDGDRALLAIDRYKAGKVIQPEGIETTDTFGGGSGGGGGGGGSGGGG